MRRSKFDDYVHVLFNRQTWDDVVMSANRYGISSSEWLASAVKCGLEMDNPIVRRSDGSIVDAQIRRPLVIVVSD